MRVGACDTAEPPSGRQPCTGQGPASPPGKVTLFQGQRALSRDHQRTNDEKRAKSSRTMVEERRKRASRRTARLSSTLLSFWLVRSQPRPPPMTDPSTTYTTSSYFETQERPESLEGELVKVRAWVVRMKEMGKRIVLVTVSRRPRLLLTCVPSLRRADALRTCAL